MKRGYLLIIATVVCFRALVPSFLFVEAKDDMPEVCTWPSETMSQYFNFQREAISIIWWSEVEERLMQLAFPGTGLFNNKVLDFPVTAIDFLATSFRVKSSISNIVTSSVLLLLISASVVESNVDGFAILFRDRPIVRDYKQMLDIETQLFDVAYFRSKQINLTLPLSNQWDMWARLEELIKTYKDNWLLSENVSISTDGSMAGIIVDLIDMNTAMKDFIAFGDDVSLFKLDKYFKNSTIEKLKNDYNWMWSFSACNSYFSSIKDTLSSMMNSNIDKVKTAWKDIKQATDRLQSALWGKWAWNFKNGRKNMCDNISEYEMAQLKAYWWPDWSCWSFVKLNWNSVDWSSISSAILEVKKYFKEKVEKRKAKKEARKVKKAERKAKKAERKAEILKEAEKRREEKEEQKAKKAAEKNAKITENSVSSELTTENKNIMSIINSNATTQEKRETWYRVFSTGVDYNPDFSVELNNSFSWAYREVMVQYKKSQENTIASDLAILPMWKWILDQIDVVLDDSKKNSSSIKNLKKDLQKIVDKQCSS